VPSTGRVNPANPANPRAPVATALGVADVIAPGVIQEAPVGPAGRIRRTFVAFGERDFRIFWLGQLVSVTGLWMQTVAQGWLVLTLTGSPFVLGLAAAARSVPVLLLVIPAGIAADRFDRRRIILATNVVATFASGLMGVLAIIGAIDVATILVIAAVLGVTNAFELPARQSYVSELVGQRYVANAIALNSLLFNSARVVGPALAGILVAVVGPGWAMLVNSISYIPVMVGLLLIRHAHVPRKVARAGAALAEAARYLRSEPRLAHLFPLLAAQTILASGPLILAPSLARDLGQEAEGLGVLLAATGVGAVFGGLRLAATFERSSRWRVLLAAGLALAAGNVGVFFAGSYAVALLCFGVQGWGMVTFNASSNTLIQTITPDRLRGRIMSLYALVLLGLMPAGGLLLGALADNLTSAAALAIGGAAYGAIILAGFAASRSLRRL
jgi:MFS family permease